MMRRLRRIFNSKRTGTSSGQIKETEEEKISQLGFLLLQVKKVILIVVEVFGVGVLLSQQCFMNILYFFKNCAIYYEYFIF